MALARKQCLTERTDLANLDNQENRQETILAMQKIPQTGIVNGNTR